MSKPSLRRIALWCCLAILVTAGELALRLEAA